MFNNTLSTNQPELDPSDDKYSPVLGLASILIVIFFLAFCLSSCTTTKNVSTARVNTDSIRTHVKDSMSAVHSREITDLNRMIEEMTSSGVTFVVDSCPEREAVLALLDSTGRANYEKIMLERRVKDLSNKVTISEKGVITAEGNIKAAYFTASKMEQEIKRVEKTNDSLIRVIESDSVRFTQSIQTKDKDVKRKPVLGGYLMSFGAGALCMLLLLWWINSKRKVKSSIMNKVTLFILSALMLTSCGKFSDGTSVWAEATWVLPLIAFLGGAIFLYLSFRASKSDSTQQYSGGTHASTGNVPIYKLGKFWFAVALFIAAIVIIVVQNHEK